HKCVVTAPSSSPHLWQSFTVLHTLYIHKQRCRLSRTVSTSPSTRPRPLLMDLSSLQPLTTVGLSRRPFKALVPPPARRQTRTSPSLTTHPSARAQPPQRMPSATRWMSPSTTPSPRATSRSSRTKRFPITFIVRAALVVPMH
ncbi:hypothetical protein E5Q_01546, partial [Mixia osmundae IAM 14324]